MGSASRYRGHDGDYDIHGPLSHNKRSQTAGAQVDEHCAGYPRDHHDEAPDNDAPVGDEWQKAMLERPPEADHDQGHPGAPGQGAMPGQRESLVGHLLGRGPNDPPNAQAVDYSPERRRMRHGAGGAGQGAHLAEHEQVAQDPSTIWARKTRGPRWRIGC